MPNPNPTPRKKGGPYCGAKKKQGPGTCTQAPGWGTDHPGAGKCKLHGGSSPIKHGLYSKIQRASLRERMAELQADPAKLLDLLPEVALLKVLTEDLLIRWDDIFGPEGALMIWWMNGRESEKRPTPPPNLPDITMVATLVDKVARVADIVQKHQQQKSVSLATLNRVMEQMGVEVAAALQEIKLDPNTATALCAVIERRWGSLRLDAYSTSDPRAAPKA